MSKKEHKSRRSRLSQTQAEAPETLSPEELAERRAGLEADAAEAARQRGRRLLRDGARLLGQRRPGEAVAKLEEAARLLTDDVDVAVNLGGAYILQRRYRKAIPVLERASRLVPDNAMVWVNLAAAYLGQLEVSGPKQQQRAIAAYERALQVDPLTPNVHYNLGLIYKDRQEWHRARAHFHRALEVDPADEDARYWLDRLETLESEANQKSIDAGDPTEDTD